MERKNSTPLNLDERVIVTFIVSAVISIGFMFLSFRYNNYEPCHAGILFKSGNHHIGEIVEFTIETNIKTKNARWDFGDKPGRIENGNKVYHTYSTPGLKKINLTINGRCTKDTSINILPLPLKDTVSSQPLISQPIFSGPEIATVGQSVSFTDSTPDAIKWTWRFGETNRIDATIQNAKYIFRTPGTKIVELIVNEKIRGTIRVLVKQKPRHRTNRHSDNAPSIPPVRIQLNEEQSN